jgi:hypothetical protein
MFAGIADALDAQRRDHGAEAGDHQANQAVYDALVKPAIGS